MGWLSVASALAPWCSAFVLSSSTFLRCSALWRSTLALSRPRHSTLSGSLRRLRWPLPAPVRACSFALSDFRRTCSFPSPAAALDCTATSSLQFWAASTLGLSSVLAFIYFDSFPRFHFTLYHSFLMVSPTVDYSDTDLSKARPLRQPALGCDNIARPHRCTSFLE